MRRWDFWKKHKNIWHSCVAVGLILLLFVVLLGQNKIAPENPMEQDDAEVSRMYLTSSTLAMDESVMAGVENANINSGEQSSDDELNEEEQEEELEEEQEEQENEEEQQENQEEQPQDIPTDYDGNSGYDSLLSLIQKNQGGQNENNESSDNPDQEGDQVLPGDTNVAVPGEGGDSTLTPEASSELFTTTIVNGECIDNPKYYFNIYLTDKGKSLNLVSQQVTVNQSAMNFKNGDYVTLKEGANQIQVTLRFRDQQYNQINAPTKTYTVYYIPANHYFIQVENAKTGDVWESGAAYSMTESECWIRIQARKGNTAVNAQVRLNNGKLSLDEDGIYRVNLKVGTNTLKVVAGTGVNQQTFICTIEYQPSTFTLSMESAAVTEQIEDGQFGGSTSATYRAGSEEFSFRISCSNTTGKESIDHIWVTNRYGTTDVLSMAGANGYISCTLDATQTTSIKVNCKDGNGVSRTYTWLITFQRTETPENKKPLITVRLSDGEQLKTPTYVVAVSAKDYQGNYLYPSQLQVMLNGQSYSYSGNDGGVYEYNLNLQQGENVLHVTATDNEQYQAVKEIHFYYVPEPSKIKVTFLMSGNSIGLGYWIRETVEVDSTTNIAELVEARLAANGFTSEHKGSVSGGYYLYAVSKPGMLNGWNISEERRQAYANQGFYVEDVADMNRLSEFDFTTGSGWMIASNNYFIGQTMSVNTLRDGDVIHVVFTLNIGEDVKSDGSSGIYG